MKDNEFNELLKKCNSELSTITINNWRNNSKKKFIFFENNSYTGNELIIKIKKQVDKIKNYKKSKLLIFLINDNSLKWLIVYISFKLINSYIFILPTHINSQQITTLKKKFKPNFVFKKNKIYKINNNSNDFEKIAKQKNIKIYKSYIYDILFTTGSASEPKGVCIEEKAYIYTAKNLIKILKQNENDCELLSMSFSHSFGLTRLRCCLITGQKIYITDGLKNFPEIYLNKKIVKYNSISMVPSALSIIKNLLKNNSKKFCSDIKYVEIGSSFINKNLRLWLKSNFKQANIMHHYGSTEASRSFFTKRGLLDNFSIDETWIGKPVKELKYKLKISKDVKNKEIKELLLSGPNISEGYIFGDKGVANIKFKKWYKTKDLVIKKNHKLYLVGKLTSLINVGGEKVLPEEIEHLLETISEIKNAICGSLKDDIFGERIGALITLNKMEKIDFDKIRNKIRRKVEKLPSFKKIKGFKIVEKIPLTINGKKNRNIDLFRKKFESL